MPSETEEWAVRELPAPSVFIQWKGTDVCADYHCLCGRSFHLDADFVYAVTCPYCSRSYMVSSMIEMKEITESEAETWNAKLGQVEPPEDWEIVTDA